MPTYALLGPTTTKLYGYPGCGWMMGGNYGAGMGGWGWIMMVGVMLFGVLTLIVLVLLAIWLAKQIKK